MREEGRKRYERGRERLSEDSKSKGGRMKRERMGGEDGEEEGRERWKRR